MRCQVKVNSPKGQEKIIDLCSSMEEMKYMTVKQLKKKVQQELGITQDIRLVFRTETLEESSLLTPYGIRHMSHDPDVTASARRNLKKTCQRPAL